MRPTLLVSLVGGPGSGKSTLGAGTFALGKSHSDLDMELALEYAKDAVYAGARFPLDPITVWGRQRERIERLRGEVDVVITDGPPLLAAIFAEQDNSVDPRLFRPFVDLVLAHHRTWPSLNVYVTRAKSFRQGGRVHNMEQSHALDVAQLAFLDAHRFAYERLPGVEDAGQVLLGMIENAYATLIPTGRDSL